MRTRSRSLPAARTAENGTHKTNRTESEPNSRVTVRPVICAAFSCRSLSRPAVSVLRAPGPVIFERLWSGALVNAPVRRLVGLVREHAFGILHMGDFAFLSRLFSGEQIFEKFPQLAVIGHVAAKHQSAVLVNHEQRVGPDAVGPVNSTVEVIDENRKLDPFEPLQVARTGELLLERAMRRIILRRVGFARVKQKE